MLETPNEKINNLTVKFIKQNYPEVHNESMMQEAMDKFIVSFNNAYKRALDTLIKQVMDEEGISRKCAEYYIGRTFKLDIELVVPKNPRTHELRANPKLVLVPRFKTPEEILYEMETATSDNPLLDADCERELLTKGTGKIQEEVYSGGIVKKIVE